MERFVRGRTVDTNAVYSPVEAGMIAGLSTAAIVAKCQSGEIKATRLSDSTFTITGASLWNWLAGTSETGKDNAMPQSTRKTAARSSSTAGTPRSGIRFPQTVRGKTTRRPFTPAERARALAAQRAGVKAKPGIASRRGPAVNRKPAAATKPKRAPAVKNELLTATAKVFGAGPAYTAIKAGHRTAQGISDYMLANGHAPTQAKRGDATAELLQWATKNYGAADALSFFAAGARTRDEFRAAYERRYRTQLDALDGTPQARAAFAMTRRRERAEHAKALRAKAKAPTLSARQRRIALDLISTGVPAAVARRLASKESA